MRDDRLPLELEELDRWYRSYPCPILDWELLSALKLTVAGALGDRWSEGDDARGTQEALRRRIKCVVRCQLAGGSAVPAAWKKFLLERGSGWLASAAALVFVVVCYGLMGGNLEQSVALQPMEWVSPVGPELADIEQALAVLEFQSEAAELVFFSSQEIEVELRKTLERILFPGLELYPDDEPNQERMVQ